MDPLAEERLIERATKFLRGLSTVRELYYILAGYGYTGEEHQRGWKLLLPLLGYDPEAGPPTFSELPPVSSQARAIAELDNRDEPLLRLAEAALTRLHPGQAAYLFEGLAPRQGIASVGVIQRFVDRYAALRDGTDEARKDLRAADRAAAETLAARNIINPEMERELRGLVTAATQPFDAPPPPDPQQAERDRHATALALKAWLDDWRETARVVVTRRDHKIRLGLARRRKAQTEIVEDIDEPAPSSPPAPTPPG